MSRCRSLLKCIIVVLDVPFWGGGRESVAGQEGSVASSSIFAVKAASASATTSPSPSPVIFKWQFYCLAPRLH